jgi:hypothetical protein
MPSSTCVGANIAAVNRTGQRQWEAWILSSDWLGEPWTDADNRRSNMIAGPKVPAFVQNSSVTAANISESRRGGGIGIVQSSRKKCICGHKHLILVEQMVRIAGDIPIAER